MVRPQGKLKPTIWMHRFTPGGSPTEPTLWIIQVGASV